MCKKKRHVFEFSALFATTFNTVHQGILTLKIHLSSTMPISTISSCLSTKMCALKARLFLRKFFLGDRSNGKKIPMKRWGDICKPRSKGGLGIRRMRNFNNSLIAKLGRNALSETFSQSQKQIL